MFISISCNLGKVCFHQLQSRKSVLPSAAVQEKCPSISCSPGKASFYQLQSRQGALISSEFLLSTNAILSFYCFLLIYIETRFTRNYIVSAHKIINLSHCIKGFVRSTDKANLFLIGSSIRIQIFSERLRREPSATEPDTYNILSERDNNT